MFSSSMRLRLTFWYTGVLALVLLIFAISSYSYLARAARQRTDNSLQDTANSFVSDFISELNDQNQSVDSAASEATRNFHFRDRQMIVYDHHRKVLAASDTPEHLPGADWFTLPATRAQLDGALNASARAGVAYATVNAGEDDVRLL